MTTVTAIDWSRGIPRVCWPRCRDEYRRLAARETPVDPAAEVARRTRADAEYQRRLAAREARRQQVRVAAGFTDVPGRGVPRVPDFVPRLSHRPLVVR